MVLHLLIMTLTWSLRLHSLEQAVTNRVAPFEQQGCVGSLLVKKWLLLMLPKTRSLCVLRHRLRRKSHVPQGIFNKATHLHLKWSLLIEYMSWPPVQPRSTSNGAQFWV